MHALSHIVQSIRGKGVIANYATDAGEGLHPQSKKDWMRTNHQESAQDQVCSLITTKFYSSDPYIYI